MTRKRIILLIGEESNQKLELLQQLQSKYNVLIPKRTTNNKELSGYSSLYQYNENINLGDLKSYERTKNCVSGLYSNTLAEAWANLYNGNGMAIIANIGLNELAYYQSHFKDAPVVGYGNKDDEEIMHLMPLFDMFIDQSSEVTSELLEELLGTVLEFSSNPILKK